MTTSRSAPLLLMALGAMISGCSPLAPRLPDPHLTDFNATTHAKIGTVHGIRGTLHAEGDEWRLHPDAHGTYLCIKVADYRRIKQSCNDTLYDLHRCAAIDAANVAKCRAIITAHKETR